MHVSEAYAMHVSAAEAEAYATDVCAAETYAAFAAQHPFRSRQRSEEREGVEEGEDEREEEGEAGLECWSKVEVEEGRRKEEERCRKGEGLVELWRRKRSELLTMLVSILLTHPHKKGESTHKPPTQVAAERDKERERVREVGEAYGSGYTLRYAMHHMPQPWNGKQGMDDTRPNSTPRVVELGVVQGRGGGAGAGAGGGGVAKGRERACKTEQGQDANEGENDRERDSLSGAGGSVEHAREADEEESLDRACVDREEGPSDERASGASLDTQHRPSACVDREEGPSDGDACLRERQGKERKTGNVEEDVKLEHINEEVKLEHINGRRVMRIRCVQVQVACPTSIHV
jgi:hypothetical protein